jgi:hypothetical protein
MVFKPARSVFQALTRPKKIKDAAKRLHHPDPFNPKTTMGWKAAVKVRTKY